uniref:Uncharacterized protein n=1 Tax=Methanococcus maripaludis (strain C6 / ATCC BAA-1332) TaxID=444158 RepID=A9A6V0_METM6
MITLENIPPATVQYDEDVSRRIVLDRVVFTVYCPFLFKRLSKSHNKQAYQEWKEKFPKNIVRVFDYGGKNSMGIKFPTERWSSDPIESQEGEVISDLTLSFTAPYVGYAYCNFNRLYMKQKGINPYEDTYKFTNVLPIYLNDEKELLNEMCVTFSDHVQELKFIYSEYLKKIFDLDIEELARDLELQETDYTSLVEVSVKQAEVDVEFLGCDQVQFEYIAETRKSNYMLRCGDWTQTEYYSKNLKSIPIQFKRYQKGAGINRHEFTWSKDASRNWLKFEDPELLYESILLGISESYLKYGFEFEGIRPIKLDGESLLQEFAEWWKLSLDITKTIIYGGATVVKFDRTTKNLREKLQRNNLIVKLESDFGRKRGIYRFSDAVERIRQALNGIYRCPECNSLMDYDYEEFAHVCKRCNHRISYSFERCSHDTEFVKFETIEPIEDEEEVKK